MRRVLGIALLAQLLVGCGIVPMTYDQWKQEQSNRRKSEQAGVPYKSPSQLRAEARDMRTLADQATFEPAKK